MGKPLKISEEAAVQMPMKTVASLIAMVAIGTWAYFGLIETQNRVTTQLEIMNKDLEMISLQIYLQWRWRACVASPWFEHLKIGR